MPVLSLQNAEDVARYDAFIRTSPFASATQDRLWAEVKEGWGSLCVYTEKEGQITGAMSLLLKPCGGGLTLAYAPKGPVCDPEDTQAILQLIREATPALKARHCFALRLDPEVKWSEEAVARYREAGFRVRGHQLDAHDTIQPRFNMVLPIGGKSYEELLSSYSEKTRYNIRYAARKGVTVRYSRDPADLETFYELNRVTALRDKIAGRPLAYFQRMLEAFPGEMLRVYVAEHEGEALSAAIALNYGEKMWYIYGASSNEKRNLMPNYAMQDSMIRWGLELGKKIYDFGGVYELTKENGLFKFKEGFCRSVGVTEYVGELDFVFNPVIYTGFVSLLPKVKAAKLRLGRSRQSRS
ncbi:MAG: peptidoglycan bridge formation glycyltransferase FemA/FemB family protein [Oscillospiraceae bacterium]|nr:peptidoglycan bridge formation glycyltransferase FemA/FemB family protein [Oscillospiraceae bacterium]